MVENVRDTQRTEKSTFLSQSINFFGNFRNAKTGIIHISHSQNNCEIRPKDEQATQKGKRDWDLNNDKNNFNVLTNLWHISQQKSTPLSWFCIQLCKRSI